MANQVRVTRERALKNLKLWEDQSNTPGLMADPHNRQLINEKLKKARYLVKRLGDNQEIILPSSEVY